MQMKKRSLVLMLSIVLPLFYLLSGVIVEATTELDMLNGLIGKYYTNNPRKYTDSGPDYLQIDKGLIATRFEDNGTIFNTEDALYGLNKDDINRVIWEGKIVPPTSGNYQFKALIDDDDYVDIIGASTTLTMSVKDGEDDKIHLDDKINIDDSDIWSGSLQANKEYTFIIEVKTRAGVSMLPTDIVIQWRLPETNNYISIPPNDLRATPDDNINVFGVNLKHLEPVDDYDGDGIPNIWETEGFVRNGSELEKYDAINHKGLVVYYTSPYAWSTDGDPYSDREEVMDNYITGDGAHPLVAAFPEVIAIPNSIKASASYQVTNANTKQEFSQTSSFSGVKTIKKDRETTSNTHGFNVGFHSETEIGLEVKATTVGIPSAYVESKTGISGEHRYSLSTGRSTTIATVTESSDTTLDGTTDFISTLITKNTADSGTLILNTYFKNIGTAPVYDCSPTVTVYIGNQAIKSLKISDIFDLRIGKQTSNLAYSTEAFRDGTRQRRLTLDYEIVKKLKERDRGGYPVSLENIDTDGVVKIIPDSSENRGKWSDYKAQMEAVTATIIHRKTDGTLKKYRVYANKNTPDSPYPTIANALRFIYKNQLTIETIPATEEEAEVKLFKIEGQEVTGFNIQTSDPYEVNQLNHMPANAVLNIDELTLTPDMVVTIETIDQGSTHPILLNTIYNQGRITATAIPNGKEIDRVEATMKVDTEVQTLNLVPNENIPNEYVYDFDSEPIIDLDYDSMVTAYIKDSIFTRKNLYFANEASIRDKYRATYGLKFTPTYENVLGLEYLIREEYPNKDVYVVSPADTIAASASYGSTILIHDLSELDSLPSDRSFRLLGYYSTDGNYKFVPLFENRELFMVRGDDASHYQIDFNIEHSDFLLVNLSSDSVTYSTHENIRFYNDYEYVTTDLLGLSNWYFSYNFFAYIDTRAKDEVDFLLSRRGPKKSSKYNFSVLGYFTSDADQIGYYYNKAPSGLNSITVGNVDGMDQMRLLPTGPEDNKLDYMNMKGLMLKISKAKEVDSRAAITINGVKAAFGTHLPIYRTGTKSVFIYVPINEGSPQELDITTESDTGIGNYKVELIGYYN